MTDRGPQRLELRDGSVVEVRPLERGDREGLAAAINRLSDESRYQRFAASKPRLSQRELDHLLDVDHHGKEALLAIDPQTRHGVAIVRYAPLPDEPGVVDVAITVGDDWQGRGLGSALLDQLIDRARTEGHNVLRASVLAANARSIALLQHAGFTPVGDSGTMRDYELRLD